MKIEKYTIKSVSRSEINPADYNPRKISEENKKKIKASIKKYGLVQPIIVNKTTGNVVGGNQRLSIMDELNKFEDYQLTIAEIECSKKDEIKLNIFLNNQSAAGEYDKDILHNIFDNYKEIDPIKDAGFDKIDLNFMFDGIDFENSLFFTQPEHKKVESEIDKIKRSDKMREYKKQSRKKFKEGKGIQDIENEDYVIIFVFNSYDGKRQFMKKIGAKESEKFLSYKKLYDILDKKYK